MKGKRVQFDDETWAALDMLARDRMMDFQEVADEAFRDLLKKHGRPTTLKEALRKSAGASAKVVPFKPGSERGANPANKPGRARTATRANAKRKMKRSKRR